MNSNFEDNIEQSSQRKGDYGQEYDDGISQLLDTLNSNGSQNKNAGEKNGS